jgi:ABC-type lipoprotein release transport system permease subunit
MSAKLFVSWPVFLPLAAFVVLLLGLVFLGKVPVRYNLRNLVVRWPITLLTALCFTLVVGLMTVMMAFVNGMYSLTSNSGLASNVFVLSDGATDEAFSNLGFGDIKQIEHWPTVLKDGEEPLASWELYVILNQPIPNAEPGQRRRRFLQLRGLDDPARTARVHNLTMRPGGAWFSSAGVQAFEGSDKSGEQAIQAVLGEGIARDLGPDAGKPTLQPGDHFEAGNHKWVVVGILASAGSTFDSEIWAKRSLIGPMFGKESYSTVVLRTADADTARSTAEDLSANFKTPAVAAQVETEYYEKLSTTNRQFLGAFLFVVVVMAIGGVFGIMNTMFAAISQRSRDIGVMRILGFARWQILASFFLESLTLALVGGALGCLIGAVVADGRTASSIVSSGQGGGKSVVLHLVVDANIILGGLLFSLLMGTLGGLLPALSAMRVKPLEAVR